MNEGDKTKLNTFENEVIDRLVALNAKRAEEERGRGAGTKSAKKPTTSKKRTRSKKGSPQLPLTAAGDVDKTNESN